MIFDFLVETNCTGTSGRRLMEFSTVKCYKIPDDRQKNVRECIEELNDHFRKHAMEISFIRNPYIDFLNFDTFYHPHVHVCKIPDTKTGKPAKYSHWMSFCMLREDQRGTAENDTFGDIFFYPSGRIGKAEVIFWRDRNLYTADFRSTKREELYLWRVNIIRRTDSRKVVMFENNPEA